MTTVATAGIDDKGPITLESFSSAVVSAAFSKDVAIRRNLWDKGAGLARPT